MEVDRRTLELLLQRADRAAPATAEERAAEAEVRRQLSESEGEWVQPALFDAESFEV